MNKRTPLLTLLLAGVIALAGGCGNSDPVVKPKEVPPMPKPGELGSPKSADGKGSLQQPTPPKPPPPLQNSNGQ
jgi:hypothetical protein